MGYVFSLIGIILTVLSSIFILVGFLLSPRDNVLRGPRSIYQKIIQKQDIKIKDSPGSIGAINVNNSPGTVINIKSTPQEMVNDGLVFNDATVSVTNKLLEISQLLKQSRLPEAETILRSFEKDDLTNKDLTNIQSVRAGIYIAQGKFPEARAIYESILDTGTKSNAVYSGLGTIAAFEAFKIKKTNPAKAVELLYKSNEWYFQALDLDKRSQALVMSYLNIYDNFRVLTQYFNQPESASTQKYKELFLQHNELAGNPYSIPGDKIIEQNFETGISKQELKSVLEGEGLDFDISSIPDNTTIKSYRIDSSNPKDPILSIEHEQ